MPSGKEAARDIARLLHAAAEEPSSLEPAADLSRLLDTESLAEIDREVRTARASAEPGAADAMLLQVERAARLAGDDGIRLWARIVRGIVAGRPHDDAWASALFEQALAEFDTVGTARDIRFLAAYADAVNWLVARAVGERRFADARDLLVRTLRHARAAQNADLEARLVLNLLSMAQQLGDLDAAEAHALALVGGAWAPLLTDDGETREGVLDLLRNTVADLDEAGSAKHDAIRTIARSVVAEAGADGPMMLALSRAAYDQEDFADSLVWLDRLLEAPEELVPGYEVRHLHHRRAVCLFNLGRRREGLEAIERAVRLAPSDPYVRYSAAQVYEAVGEARRSVDEYAETARLAEERMAEPRAAPAPQPRSAEEYAANVPVEDLRDFALLQQAQALRHLGERAEAAAVLERLEAIADAITGTSALLMMAKWAEEEERLEDARALLERAQAIGSHRQDEIDLRLVSVLIALGDFERALEVLAPLCHKSRAPEECIELLGRIPESWPGYPLVRKWRGYATTEAGRPRDGFAELEAAVQALPDDADALHKRALARITFGVEEGQDEWNGSRAMRHVAASLNDLYAALRIRPGDEETLRVLKWLVERAASHPEMYEIFSAGGSPEGDLFSAFPHLKDAFEASWRANHLGFERRFEEAARVWAEVQLAHERAGFEILAGRVSIRLADVYLRLLDLDAVAMHLQRAGKVRFLVNVPLSLDVLARYEEFAAGRGHLQEPTLGREVEYAWLYDHVIHSEIRLMFLTANYRHRVGDVRGALEAVDFLQPILAHVEENVPSIFGLEEALWAVAVLRDGGRTDEALDLLDRLQALPAAVGRAFDLIYTRGLVHDVRGELELALEAYEQAHAIAAERARPVGAETHLQYAASLLNVGRTADAWRALERVDIDGMARSDRERLTYHALAAWIHDANGEISEGIRSVEQAIPIVEEVRAEIADPTSRRAWQGQHQNVFSVAVKLYARAGRARRAWEMVELSRARTLLDDLLGSRTASPEHEAAVAALETLESTIRLVERDLVDGDGAAGALGTEAVARLAALLEPRFADVVTSQPFRKADFGAVRDELVGRRDAAIARERQARERAGRPTGSLVEFDALTGMLAE